MTIKFMAGASVASLLLASCASFQQSGSGSGAAGNAAENPCPEPERVVMSYMKDGTPIYAEPEPVLYRPEECQTVPEPVVLGAQDIVGTSGGGGNSPPPGGNEPPTGGNEPPTGGNEPPTGGNEPPTGGNEPPTGGNEPPTSSKGKGQNNGWGNGDDDAPGGSKPNNGAENNNNGQGGAKDPPPGAKEKKNSELFQPLDENGLEFAGLNGLRFAGLQDLQFAEYKFGRQTSPTVVDRDFLVSYSMILPTIASDDAED